MKPSLTQNAALCELKWPFFLLVSSPWTTNSSTAGFISCSSLHLWHLIKHLTHGKYRTFRGFPQHICLLSSTHAIHFSSPPCTIIETQMSYLIPILHMHSGFYPFMPVQGHHYTSFLSLSSIITFNSAKNNLLIIGSFYSQF